jgi:hypothetical protein
MWICLGRRGLLRSSMAMSPIHRAVLDHVERCPDSPCKCAIQMSGVANEDVLSAAQDLVERGFLIGAFPTNPNWRDGFEWGYLAKP